METVNIFIALIIICAVWHVTVTMIIYNSLQKRGRPVSFFWLRILAPRYAYQYKEITKTETGRAGALFYHWVISINLALLFAVLAAISAL